MFCVIAQTPQLKFLHLNTESGLAEVAVAVSNNQLYNNSRPNCTPVDKHHFNAVYKLENFGLLNQGQI